MKKQHLVVVDDEVDLAEFISIIAQEEGFIVTKFYNGKDFLDNYNIEIDVIILDLMIPDIDGIGIMAQLAKRNSNAKVILTSGVDEGVLQASKQIATGNGLDVVATISKPFRKDTLSKTLSKLSVEF